MRQICDNIIMPISSDTVQHCQKKRAAEKDLGINFWILKSAFKELKMFLVIVI